MAEQTTVVGGEALRDALRRAGAAGVKALARGLRREAEAIMTDSKEHYVPTNISTLKTSGFVQPVQVSATGVTVTLGYGGAAQAYALYVHEGIGPAVGRPAFMPPVKALIPWVLRHGMPEEAAFPIARAIGRRGLAPTKYLERPLLAAVRGMDGRLAADVNGGLAKAGTGGAGATSTGVRGGETWKQFVGARMGAAMRETGGHGAAMKKLGAEWRARKGT